jgi:uncharacterized protein YqhQ
MSAPLRLGGMALSNGLLVHGPTAWAAAVRRTDGTIATASGAKPRIGGVDRLPGLRGVARMAEAFAVIPLVVRALPEARLPFARPAVLAAAAGATAAGRTLRGRGAAGDAAAALVALAPSFVALRGGELAAYHGVEHKAIAAYETGGAEARDAAKEHDRCGSHLMTPMLAANVAGATLLRRAVDRPGPLAHSAVAVGSLGLAVEVFLWSERNAGSRIARALRRPGHELQRAIGTREPTAEQLEVGRAALEAILRAEGAPAPS